LKFSQSHNAAKKKGEYEGIGEEVGQIKVVHEGRMDRTSMIGRRESG
jgi:hypothetical protein